MTRSVDDIQRGSLLRRYLSALYCEPDVEVLREERVLSSVLDLCDRETLDDSVAAYLGRDLDGVDAKSLLVDYARLFVGPDKLPAPPYGSVHLEPERQVMGATTFDVIAFYESCGMRVEADVHEPPDHIAIELEFSSWLLEKALAALAEGREDEAKTRLEQQQEFESRFVLPWARTLAELVLDHAKTQHYRAVAAVTLHALYGEETGASAPRERAEGEATGGQPSAN